MTARAEAHTKSQGKTFAGPGGKTAPLLAGLLLAAAAIAAAAPRYTITDLGTLGGASGTSDSTAINSAGAVAGTTPTAIFEASAAVFAAGQWTDLGALAAASGTGWTNLPQALGINDAGQVTGYGFVSGGAGFHAFLYAGGAFVDLNAAIGGTKSQGLAINATGQVAGFYNTTDTPSQVHAFLYSDGAAVDLGTLGGTYSAANAINAGGTVVGESYTGTGSHAFAYTTGAGISDLGTLAGDASQSVGYYSVARGINDAGVIVGDSDGPGLGTLHAARYAGGKWADLGTLGGHGSSAKAINAAGTIVGDAEISTSSVLRHAFVWSGGAMADLNTLLPAGSGWELLTASAINAAGQITGQGTNPQGDRRAYLLTPIPVAPVDPVAKPVVRITGKKKLTTAKAKVTIRGKATGQVTSITAKLGKKTVKARGTASWSLKAPLKPGRNVLTVTAHGPGGDSAPARLTITRKP